MKIREIKRILIRIDKSIFKELGKIGKGTFAESEYRNMIRGQLAIALHKEMEKECILARIEEQDKHYKYTYDQRKQRIIQLKQEL